MVAVVSALSLNMDGRAESLPAPCIMTYHDDGRGVYRDGVDTTGASTKNPRRSYGSGVTARLEVVCCDPTRRTDVEPTSCGVRACTGHTRPHHENELLLRSHVAGG